MRHRECTGRNCVFYRLERWLCSRITGGPCTLMTAFKPFKAGGDSSCFPRTSTYASRHQRRRLQLDGRFTAAAFIKRGPIWRWQKNNKNLMLMHHRGWWQVHCRPLYIEGQLFVSSLRGFDVEQLLFAKDFSPRARTVASYSPRKCTVAKTNNFGTLCLVFERMCPHPHHLGLVFFPPPPGIK